MVRKKEDVKRNKQGVSIVEDMSFESNESELFDKYRKLKDQYKKLERDFNVCIEHLQKVIHWAKLDSMFAMGSRIKSADQQRWNQLVQPAIDFVEKKNR